MRPLPIAATFSKDPKFFARGFEPAVLTGGFGATVYSSKEDYIDWISGLGANILGYAHSEFCQRVVQAVWEGAGFSLPHYLEQQVAEKLVTLLGNHVPGWAPETLGVRFGLSGTDATTMAVRLARAITGRTLIVSCSYHGWADWSVGATPPAWGIEPQDVLDIAFSDSHALPDILADSEMLPAAVIAEVPIEDVSLRWWALVQSLCTQRGALFILDEVVTWPRYALGGAAELLGLQPDIVCLGKGLGNGIPSSCMVGWRDYFDWFDRDDPCFVSSTGFGNAVSLAAADAVLDLWNQKCVEHIWEIGQKLLDGLQNTGYKLAGNAPRSLFQFESLAAKTYFVLEMRNRGILMNRPNLPNLAHSEKEVAKTLEAAAEIQLDLQRLGSEVENLMAGKLPRVLFSKR